MNFIEVTERLEKRPRVVAIAHIVWVEPSDPTSFDGSRIYVVGDRAFDVRDSYAEICALLKKAVTQ